jgi:hypothetical protein
MKEGEKGRKVAKGGGEGRWRREMTKVGDEGR